MAMFAFVTKARFPRQLSARKNCYCSTCCEVPINRLPSAEACHPTFNYRLIKIIPRFMNVCLCVFADRREKLHFPTGKAPTRLSTNERWILHVFWCVCVYSIAFFFGWDYCRCRSLFLRLWTRCKIALAKAYQWKWRSDLLRIDASIISADGKMILKCETFESGIAFSRNNSIGVQRL